jgi:transposase-like protein
MKDEKTCHQCGSYTHRIRRTLMQKLRYPGSKRYRCGACDAVYQVMKDGSRQSEQSSQTSS